jgi:hypothetical protein
MNTLLASFVLSAGLLGVPDAKDRPIVEARIDDQPVRMTLDTGSGRLVVFAHVADRIGLKYDKPHGFDPNRVRSGRVPLFRSDTCTVQVENSGHLPVRIDNADGRRRVWIAEIPAGFRFPDIDGIVGWPNLSRNVLHLDWGQSTLESLPQVPARVLAWHSFKLYPPPGVQVLALRVSESPSFKKKAVYLDTGDPGGVKVSSGLWEEIVAQHPRLPVAIEGYYTPSDGCVLLRICWLRTLKLGDLVLHDVPVSEMPPKQQGLPSCWASVGLYGLTRLELFIDAKYDRAYVGTKRDYPKGYDYNRSGAVFLPLDARSSDLVATVLERGPAWEAGIRNGDRLLRVNGRDVTGWRTDPNVTKRPSCFSQPAGTKVNLTVLREGQPLDVTVVLQELLPVQASPTLPQEDKS